MKELYVVSIGGKLTGTNIEMHDIQFVTAESFEATHEILKEVWFGESLHADSYGILSHVDGYDVTVSSKDSEETNKVFFVYMGGYKDGIFGELHEIGFVVADSKENAKQKAMENFLNGVNQKHVDEIRQVDLVMRDADSDNTKLRLVPSEVKTHFKPEWNGYLKLR